VREITVFTHRRPDDTGPALALLASRAREAGVTLRLDSEETAKHALIAGQGLEVDQEVKRDVELCVVLGGDGTILRALQSYAGTGVPVFAINFGEIGFLATVEPGEIDDGIRRALSGEFELLHLPGIVLDTRNDANGITVSIVIRDLALIPELQRRVAHELETSRQLRHE